MYIVNVYILYFITYVNVYILYFITYVNVYILYFITYDKSISENCNTVKILERYVLWLFIE